MESAIPRHLRCPRTRDRRMADDYLPPFPSTVARFDASVKHVVMAYFGLQHPSGIPRTAVALHQLAEAFAVDDGPSHSDLATYIDEADYQNTIRIGYWSDAARFNRWFDRYGAAWTDGGIAGDGIGSFVEILRPSVERFETLFSSEQPEGIAKLSTGFSEPILEHGYWGGARDRLALSQIDGMVPSGAPRLISDGVKRRIVPHDNICLIRSGQDWSATADEERRLYVRNIEPVLHVGMDFLRDHGSDVGCIANRYMRVLDAQQCATEKSFGMSWWHSLAHLEHWSETHPTHLAIFNAAMQYLAAMGQRAQLRLYHEVSVAQADEQFFEYYNCHAKTGLLNAMPG